MSAKPGRRVGRRLAVTLGLWILPAVMLSMAASLWMSAATVIELSDSAYDRSLAGAIRAIDANISTESGGVGVELPYNLFEFFQLTAQGRVYFNVSTDDGLVQIGDVLLPPAGDIEPDVLKFEDVGYFGETIRLGSLRRSLDPERPDGTSITIQVAETKGSRSVFQTMLMERAIQRDLLVLVALGLMLSIGVYFAVKPLRRLRDAIDRREPFDPTPIDGTGLPSEVRPLVEAINRLMARNLEQAEQQHRFLDDASHQLRTPMAIVRTQVDVALHESDLTKVRETLRAAKDVLDRAARTTNQLLSLARARSSGGTDLYPLQSIDLSEIAADSIRLIWPRLRHRRMDCTLDAAEKPMLVLANEGLVREALSNILDNAVSYAAARSTISVRLLRTGEQIVLQVEDEGPGMSDEEIANVGVRFRRGTAGQTKAGSGLGLAIAFTAAKANNGMLSLSQRQDRNGLIVSLSLQASTL